MRIRVVTADRHRWYYKLVDSFFEVHAVPYQGRYRLLDTPENRETLSRRYTGLGINFIIRDGSIHNAEGFLFEDCETNMYSSNKQGAFLLKEDECDVL